MSLLLAAKVWIVVIDKDSALTNGRYRKEFNEYAIPLISRCQYVNYATFPFEYNMDSNKELKDRERIAKQMRKPVIQLKSIAF